MIENTMRKLARQIIRTASIVYLLDKTGASTSDAKDIFSAIIEI
jgi:hypothetical protein